MAEIRKNRHFISSSLQVRPATPDDCNRLLEIYTPYVQTTAITFEYIPPTASEFKRRIEHTLGKYPYLVIEENGHILGYTYASPFKERAAYDWAVETSIYVDSTAHKRGLGSMLYEALEAYLIKQHIVNVCACIAYPNPESIAFHEAHGFETVAHFHKCGYKFNTWYDMVWMEKFIGTHDPSQTPILSFKEVV